MAAATTNRSRRCANAGLRRFLVSVSAPRAIAQHITEKLEAKCDVNAPSGCSPKEVEFINKFKGMGAEARAAELKRLEGMKGNKMKPDLKTSVMQRINVLKQLATAKDL